MVLSACYSKKKKKKKGKNNKKSLLRNLCEGCLDEYLQMIHSLLQPCQGFNEIAWRLNENFFMQSIY